MQHVYGKKKEYVCVQFLSEAFMFVGNKQF